MGAKRLLRLAAAGAGLSLVLAGCGGVTTDAGGDAPAGKKGTVKLAINNWTGYEANAAVIAYLLENELDYKVDEKNLKEEVSWQGFESGTVDAIVENWGHDDLKKKYIDEKKVAVNAGPTGNDGIIGWYVPKWMTEKYPDITDYKNLNKYAHLFKTSESGGKGQFLAGDPSFVTNDEALVKNLGLNFKVVYSGSEASIIKAAQQADKQKTPLLFYFYAPQWLHSQIDLVQVKLPPYKAGCDADAKKVACDYPPYVLDKIVSKKFADSGGPAYELIKNFKWMNDDQDQIADWIINDKLTPEKAAEKWVKANEDTWKAWIPKS